ncbi:ATP-dependent Clp protease ATP-binding subunit CLPT1, chloroplastic-like isoform X6 [Musa acuminata AAA Group]|uniref:ATP-dependent Clp protease ATP-binding subunit CLPT1, chloroplastic-like isoform X6 n=1 Tax=Musa acuminata AAA Group TaxID=214697 RepID=UPI0031DEFE3D
MAARILSFLPIPTASSRSSAPVKSMSSLSPPPNHHAVRLRSFLIAIPISVAPSLLFPRPSLRSAASVVSILPTAKPERASAEKLPRWSLRAIKAFGMAELEARKLKYPKTGTEALLMGILVEGTSETAKFLRANGITVFKLREETVKLLGKSDMYFFSPEHPPLTEPAQRALDWAVDEKLKSGEDGEITTAHLLLGIWSEKESAGHKILASLGFDDEKASELAKSADKDIVMKYR